MSIKEFETLVGPLLRYLNVSMPSMGNGQAILIEFKNLRLQLTPLNDRELLMAASLGVLPVDIYPLLGWKLLAKNDIDEVGPPILVSIVESNNMLMLWCRERLGQLNPAELIALFERMLHKAGSVRQVIANEVGACQASANRNEIDKAQATLAVSRIKHEL